jgi:ferrochelatase
LSASYDAILVVSFGGPEGPDEVIPFLENVLRGRNVPRERMLAVAEHYDHFGGVSPINQQVRDLIAALESELFRHGINLPIYWGNRNWHPMLTDTVRQMAGRGVKRALGLVLSAYGSYSSCRQYREDIERAREAVGNDAPQIDKIRVFYNHPEFVAAQADRLQTALAELSAPERARAHIAFTAHSIPMTMADRCDYALQLSETCRLVAEQLGSANDRWKLVYQSRSGRPTDPWLGPDICDHLKSAKEQGVDCVVVMPVGFLSDHLEVLYDLDVEARRVSQELGITMLRGGTVGTHPRFVGMLRELIAERMDSSLTPRAVGIFGPRLECPVDCCLALPRIG